ncbi:negative regulation of innate immune response [Paramecium bursaria]
MDQLRLKCEHCEQMILENNYLLHSLYCMQNIIKCPTCNAPIDRSDQEHPKLHEEKKCGFCENQFETQIFEVHFKQCPMRPKQCDFCELQFKPIELMKHQLECGSRTDECKLCLAKVKKNGMQLFFEVEQITHDFLCKIDNEKKQQRQPQVQPKREKAPILVSSDEESKQSRPKLRRLAKLDQDSPPQREIKKVERQRRPQQREVVTDDDEEVQKAIALSLEEH